MHAANSLGATQAEMNSHLAESWLDIRDNNRDAQGNGWTWVSYNCNYDCNTWTPTL
jgi:hypothetical protein